MKIDPKQLFWGFGNHEPISMYQRGGINTTGGVPGNALWLKKWHNFYDSEESAALLEHLGVNIIHCRFYKGMGWDYEKEDFPNVRKFAENCRKHNIKVLAYVQYASLYWELMQKEIPNLKEWAIVNANGKFEDYNGQYWRWMPCATSQEFVDYTCKVLQIALDAKCFDGVMFDNMTSPSCHCPRCQAKFKEYLKKHCREYTFLDPDHTEIPPFLGYHLEGHDPLYRAEVEFRTEQVTKNFQTFRKYIKERNPEFIITGNFAITPTQNAYKAIDEFAVAKTLDIIVAQSDNDVKIKDGCVVTQVPELKFARAIGVPAMPLNDKCAATPDGKPEFLIARLCESLFGGGVPVERSAMRPLRGGDPDMELIGDRKRVVDQLKKWIVKYKDLLELPHYEPISVLYSLESMRYSFEAVQAMLKVQESLMRNQIPYRLILCDKNGMLNDDWQQSKVVIVPGCKLLSDKVVAALNAFKGRLIVTGAETGDYDENFSQRAENPFVNAEIAELPPHEVLSVGYRTRVRFTGDNWKSLFREVPRTEMMKESVVDYKCDAKGNITGVLLSCALPCCGGMIELPQGNWVAEPFGEAEQPVRFLNGMAAVPAFNGACVLSLR